MTREHHFYCAIAKQVFAHRTHGIVFVRDPIRLEDAKHYGLQPMLLYGVTAAGTPLKRITLSPLSTPLAFSMVLEEAWRSAAGLRGLPTTVKVNRHIADACPKLTDSLETLGINLIVAGATDKQFPSSLRSAQQDALEMGWHEATNTPRIGSAEAFNVASLNDHRQNLHYEFWRTGNRERTTRIQTWLELPAQPLTVSVPDSGPWATGPWLSSWEVALPPAAGRLWHIAEGGNVWLIEGNTDSASDRDDRDGETTAWDDVPEKAKLLIACWPNKSAEIATAIGTTQRELQWFLNKRAAIAEEARLRLINLLGLVYREEYNEYEPNLPRVLVASSLRATIAAYDEVSHGGDLAMSFEAVPEQSAADPSWRYVVMESCGGLPTIIMFPRGSTVADKLDESHFINYQGLQPIKDGVYRDLVHTCGKACASAVENRKVATEFARRHLDYLEEFERGF